MKRLLGAAMAMALLSGPTYADDLTPPADQRFAKAKGDDVPEFQRHVIPLLGRLGCNGRACHGSFQGQAGFRLSLFGHDFKADHTALARGESPRGHLKTSARRLMLQKPNATGRPKGSKRLWARN